MKLKLLKLQSAAVGAIFALMPLSGAVAEEWKFAIEDPSGSIMDVYAQDFKTRIEAATKGDVTVTIYPMGSLGSSSDIIEQTADGVIQFTHVIAGALGTMVPESQLLLLPYLLPSDADASSKILSSSKTIYEELNKDFRKKGLEVLTVYSQGAQVWTTNEEIHSPEDFENFKMRVPVSPILIETYKSMGASPTPLPFGEVYGALQLGAIDGQFNPIPTIEDMKFYEVTDYLTWAGERDLITTVITSPDWFETLSPDRQKLVRDTMSEMTDDMRDVVTDFNKERLDVILKAKPDIKRVVLNDEERDVFRSRSAGTANVYVEQVGERGQQLLDSLKSEIAATK